MKQNIKTTFFEMRTFLLLWTTQSFSGLGSAMTSYALVIWSYTQKGSALVTALLMVCSYAPYVVFSIFAGALSDRFDKKKTMLVCDAAAAATSVIMLLLLRADRLEIWHLYVGNVIAGLMNTVWQPASEVAVTRVLPKKYYQKVGGLRYLGNSLNSILAPLIGTAVLGIAGIQMVFVFDLCTFLTAFFVLAFVIRIPEGEQKAEVKEGLLVAAGRGISFLKKEKGIFHLILFLAAINLVASIYDAAFPAMVLSRNGGSERALGIVNAVIGAAALSGSVLATLWKEPKSRVRVICCCLLFSMGTENIFLALGRTPLIWGIGGFLGWIVIPLMDTNLDAILRLRIPVEMQGRVYSVRNSFQFFTIPLGYFLGGMLVDTVFEPFMAHQNSGSILVRLFGEGKGSGAALLFLVLAFVGVLVCLYFWHDRHIWEIEKE